MIISGDTKKLRERYLNKYANSVLKQNKTLEEVRSIRNIKNNKKNKKYTIENLGDFSSRKEPSYYKKYFNKFFKEDTYDKYWKEDNILLSTGSLDENQFPLFESMKYTIEFAMMKNWYGYSSCVGRDSARKAVALLENSVIGKKDYYSADNVCVTMGVTAALSDVLQFIKKKKKKDKMKILTHTPSYAPFVEGCEENGDIVYFSLNENGFDVDELISQVTEEIDVLVLTGDLNPIGKTTRKEDLEKISKACLSKSVYFLYDRAGRKNGKIDYEAFEITPYSIIFESLSKKISIPGMKIGYFLASHNFLEEFYEYASTYYGGPPSFFYLLLEMDSIFTKYYIEGKKTVQKEDCSYFEDTYEYDTEWVQASYENYINGIEYNHELIQLQREICIDILKDCQKIKKIIEPNTGVNLFVLIDCNKSSYSFYEDLIKEKGVAVFPGICSGLDRGCWLRITVSGNYQNLVEGVMRIKEYLSDYKEE